MKRILANIGLFLCIAGFSYAQEVVSPLNIPLFLSGNFGELRNDHFHSGLDFKTQGTTGLPVKAIKAGFISRISVGPTGFGRAVYIDHPDGTTSVYGHLNNFAPKIESAVRDSQYVYESFSVNLTFSNRDFPVRQGEIIAYSGNTGSSGGPHLHLELRNTKTEKTIDPLPAFQYLMKDNRPPEIRSLLLVPQQGTGVVNGKSGKQIIDVIKSKNGKYVLSKPIKAWGMIGLGIKAYDRMDGTSNAYGVKEIRLRVNNVEIFHSIMNGFFFDETRYLNSLVDWEEWKTNRSFFMKSFIDPGNKLGIYLSGSNGLIPINEAKTYNCEYMLRDAFGNVSTFNFTITGENQSIPAEKKDGVLFPYNRDNEYSGKGITLNIPAGNLYTNVYLNPEAIQQPGEYPFSPLYSMGERAPLHSSGLLTLAITNDSYPDKSKYGVVAIVNNKNVWLGGDYEFKKLKVKILELGLFTVAIDTIPPVVIPQNQARWTLNKCISFKVTDDLSGIDFYRGRLDGKFALFEYDPKSNSLFCKYDANRMKKGKQTLTLVVRDGVKNETNVRYEVEL